MRNKQVAKNQLTNEMTKQRQRFAKSEKSETRHKQAEQALRESEENYKQLTESISDVFFEMDKDLRYTYWNRASEKLTGFSAKDTIGKSLSELFPDTLQIRKAKRVYLDVLRTQQPQTFINEYKLGGKDFIFDIIAYPSKRGISVFVKDITDRKQAEEELREKEEFNFALFQHNPIQTIVVDRRGRVLKVNMAKRKSGDRMPNIGDVMYKDYAAKHGIDMHAELMECIRSSKAKSFSELKYGDKFLNILIAPFPQGAIITSLDITERKRTEEEKDRLLKTIETTKEAINFTTPDAIMKYANDAMEELFGYKKGELIGKHVSVLNAGPSRKAKKMPEHITDAIKKKGVWEGEIHNKRKDGTEFICLAKVGALTDKNGKIINYVSSQHDITEHKKAEDALRESEERYRAIFDQAADSIVLIDGETGDLVEFNEKAYENLGYTREEFKKLKIPDFEAIESAEKVATHIKKITRDGSDIFETKHRTKGGEIRDILVSSRAISIGGKDFIQSIWSDITDRKRAEEEIKSSQSQLRNLAAHLQSVREEERTLIAREMHDELGQALTAMKMDLSWLDNRLPKDQKPLFEKTKSMSKLADATLQTIKKISTELRPGLLDDLGLPAAIEWQTEEFQTRTGIKCEITKDPEDIILDKDRSTAIFRIFQETLTNVARHAKATRIKVSLKEKAGKIELKVRDNGKGITEEQVSDPKSFGLIGIMERAYYLDGKAVIKGLQDKGTTLTIRIPLPKKGKTK